MQIGYYDEVIHGTIEWFKGKRFVMNLSLQKKILTHFQTYGSEIYKHYVNSGYPSGPFHVRVNRGDELKRGEEEERERERRIKR